jgi:hypothetical protein
MRYMKQFAVLLLTLQPAPTQGQVRYVDPTDPRVKRAWREQAVANVGPIARGLVETHGDAAVAAIFACSKATAVKLAQFHASGELNKLPRPAALLNAISAVAPGDAVANFAMQHADALADVTRFNVFLAEPLTYAMSLKSLDAGVDEYRRRLEWRENAQRKHEMTRREELVTAAILAGAWLLAAILILRYRDRIQAWQS